MLHESEAIKTHLTLATWTGTCSNQSTACVLVTLYKESNLTAYPVPHDTHDTYIVHIAQVVGVAEDFQKAEWIRLISRSTTSRTVGFQYTAYGITEYVTKWMKAIEHGPWLFSDCGITLIWAAVNIEQEIIDAQVSQSLE